MINIIDRKRESYNVSWQAMCEHVDQRTKEAADEVWLVEHNPVFTLGQTGDRSHLLTRTDIPVIHSDRGGHVTYHGPGQLVAYVLINLKRANLNIRTLVTQLENSIIGTLAHYRITSEGSREAPGVYVNQLKIASIGLRIRHGFSYHGLALNVNNDLAPFKQINPCGYADLNMTRLADYHPEITVDEVKPILVKQLKDFIFS